MERYNSPKNFFEEGGEAQIFYSPKDVPKQPVSILVYDFNHAITVNTLDEYFRVIMTYDVTTIKYYLNGSQYTLMRNGPVMYIEKVKT